MIHNIFFHNLAIIWPNIQLLTSSVNDKVYESTYKSPQLKRT